MKVRFVKSLEDWTVTDITIGQVYEVVELDESGDAVILDDIGEINGLYFGEYEVIEE